MNSAKTEEVTFTLRIPAALRARAKDMAQAEHVSLNSLILRLLERETAKKGKQS